VPLPKLRKPVGLDNVKPVGPADVKFKKKDSPKNFKAYCHIGHVCQVS